jgi:hypothetical protein
MAWGAEGTASTSILNRTNASINLSPLVQEQNVEAGIRQFQASEDTRGTGTDYGDIIIFGHRDSF